MQNQDSKSNEAKLLLPALDSQVELSEQDYLDLLDEIRENNPAPTEITNDLDAEGNPIFIPDDK